MPETRSKAMTPVEEERFILAHEDVETAGATTNERFARSSEGSSLQTEHTATIAALEREMARISDQLTRLSIGAASNAVNHGSISRNVTSEEDVLKSLQTPSSVRDLTPFDGNPLKLHQFLKAVDRVMPIMERVKNSPTFDVWMQAIRSKIIGEADTVLELYGTELEWDDIKTNLTAHYSDKRDEVSLCMDLFQLKQEGSFQNFYEKVTHIISLLVNQLLINESDPNVKLSRRKYYQEIGLKVFVAGLRPPLGPTIRAQKPKTLKEAHRFYLEEGNISYVQNLGKAMSGAIPKQLPSQNHHLGIRFPGKNFKGNPLTKKVTTKNPIQSPSQDHLPLHNNLNILGHTKASDQALPTSEELSPNKSKGHRQPREMHDEAVSNSHPQHQPTSNTESDTSDELNFHLAEQAEMKR